MCGVALGEYHERSVSGAFAQICGDFHAGGRGRRLRLGRHPAARAAQHLRVLDQPRRHHRPDHRRADPALRASAPAAAAHHHGVVPDLLQHHPDLPDQGERGQGRAGDEFSLHRRIAGIARADRQGHRRDQADHEEDLRCGRARRGEYAEHCAVEQAARGLARGDPAGLCRPEQARRHHPEPAEAGGALPQCPPLRAGRRFRQCAAQL